MRPIVLSLLLALTTLLAACGFQLRGSYSLPFSTISITLPATSELYSALRRSIEASSSARVVAEANEAEAVLMVLGDSTEKSILSLNTSGRVREFQLIRNFQFKLVDSKGLDLVPPSQITLRREMTFSDDQVLSKESEESLIRREIGNDLVQQVMRRLSAAKPRTE